MSVAALLSDNPVALELYIASLERMLDGKLLTMPTTDTRLGFREFEALGHHSRGRTSGNRRSRKLSDIGRRMRMSRYHRPELERQ